MPRGVGLPQTDAELVDSFGLFISLIALHFCGFFGLEIEIKYE